MPEDKTEERTFTQSEHEALLTDTVRREVAEAIEEHETDNEELRNRVDVLEAEKAELEKAKEELQTEFDEFKQELERAGEVAARKTERVEAIKEISAVEPPDSYFSDERVERWAEMSDEQFGDLLDDLSAQAVTHLDPEDAKALEGLEGEDRRSKVAELVKAHKEAKAPDEGKDDPVMTETAAFSGGKAPSGGGGSSFSRWLGARGHAEPVNN